MLLKKSIVAVSALTLLALSSCTNRLTDFTVISTKNVPIGNQPTNLVKGNQRVKGVDKSHMILFVPLGSPNLKEAIDKAIESAPGAIALADGVVKSTFMDFLFYGQSSYVVEGTPLFPEDAIPNSNSQGNINNTNTYNPGNHDNTIREKSVMRITHEVNMEKNVSEIAKMYEVSVPDIMKWNKLSSPSLNKGQKIIIYLNE